MSSKKIMGIVWYWWIVLLLLFGELAVFLFFGGDSYIGIHDNLDIHIADYQVLRLNHAFFSHGQELPLLGGIDRNFLLSEVSLYSLLYVLLPNFAAYVAGYFLKILIALGSGILLGKDILKEKYESYAWLVVLGSLTYGLLPLYPAFSFSFASLPLFVFLIRRIRDQKGKRYYLFLFLYPLLSYFTFFGPFLVGYLFLYTLYRCVKERKICGRLPAAVLLLCCGYAVVEYRLFFLMFASGRPTIRETMVMGADSAAAICRNIADVFVNSIFHAEDVHRWFVLPVCMIYLFWLNAGYIRRRKWKEAFGDYFNLIFLLLVFNCVIYGIYTWEGFRTVIETAVPPLKGWQFNRTVFFNPFLWYAELFMIAGRLYGKNRKRISLALVLLAMLVPLGKQTLYNDFYNTVYTHAYMLVKQKDTQSLSYREFYSQALFDNIKEEIGYGGEYAAAYGMHPAVLNYNGIATLDGCLSYYYQSYKEEFRKVIAPALEENEAGRVYFDDWGARAYLFSATDDTVWNPVKVMNVTDERLFIDADAFRRLGGVWIFSRIRISNDAQLGLSLKGCYRDPSSPYTIYVYRA